MTSDREKILKKINVLLNMTTENGASENEAMMAASRANDLMLEYNLSLEDISEVKGDSYGMRRRKFATGSIKRRHFHEVKDCTNAIAEFCDCENWFDGMELVFCGTRNDTQFAWYLTDMIKNAMENEYRKAEGSLKRQYNGRLHGRKIRYSFMMGMISRINARLREMKNQRDNKFQTESKTGNSLMVVKNQMVKQTMKAAGINLQYTPKPARTVYGDAFSAGRAAANNVNFDRPIGGNNGGKSKRISN